MPRRTAGERLLDLAREGYEVVLTPKTPDGNPGATLEVRGGGLTVRRVFTEKALGRVGVSVERLVCSVLDEVPKAIGEYLEEDIRRSG